jgi:hypothetical protein
MSRLSSWILFASLVVGSSAASAQSLDDFDKILLPLNPERAQGAFVIG